VQNKELISWNYQFRSASEGQCRICYLWNANGRWVSSTSR